MIMLWPAANEITFLMQFFFSILFLIVIYFFFEDSDDNYDTVHFG